MGPEANTAEAVWHAQLLLLWQSRAHYTHAALDAYRTQIRDLAHSSRLSGDALLLATHNERLDTTAGVFRIGKDTLLAPEGLSGTVQTEPDRPALPPEATGFAVFRGGERLRINLFAHPFCARSRSTPSAACPGTSSPKSPRSAQRSPPPRSRTSSRTRCFSATSPTRSPSATSPACSRATPPCLTAFPKTPLTHSRSPDAPAPHPHPASASDSESAPYRSHAMQSTMDRDQHHAAVQRALALGRSTDPAALPELVALLATPSPEVRRLTASAIGKLAGFGADASAAVRALTPIALRDPHPQAQQYALKALKAYGVAAHGLLHDLQDLAANTRAKDYVRMAAHSAAETIFEAARAAAGAAVHRCLKCNRDVAPDEYDRAQKAFQRTYCDHCFDEVFLTRRNWETQVELNKTIEAADGTLVQSDGERLIAEWLSAHGIAFRYDNRFRIIKGYAIRPDFYLPEHDLYLEYWGMEDNLDYQIGMLEKKKLYQSAGKRLLSFYRHEKPDLPRLLHERLSRYMRLAHPAPLVGERSESAPTSGGHHP